MGRLADVLIERLGWLWQCAQVEERKVRELLDDAATLRRLRGRARAVALVGQEPEYLTAELDQALAASAWKIQHAMELNRAVAAALRQLVASCFGPQALGKFDFLTAEPPAETYLWKRAPDLGPYDPDDDAAPQQELLDTTDDQTLARGREKAHPGTEGIGGTPGQAALAGANQRPITPG